MNTLLLIVTILATLGGPAMRQRMIVPGPVAGYELNPRRGAWGVIIPQETTNYAPNPSAEVDTAGWTGGLGTVVSLDPDAYSGQYSILLTAGGIIVRADYAIGTLTANQYTYSSWVKAKAGKVRLTPIIGGSQGNSYDFYGVSWEEWTRITLTVTLSVSATLTFRYNNVISTDLDPIKVDAQQVEIGPFATSYFDGDSGKDYVWTGTAHASTSIRLVTASDGGRVKRFEEFGFRIKGYQGASMPVHDAARQPYGILDGAVYQGTRITERVVALLGDFSAPDIQGLQRQKDSLIRAVNRDTNLSDAPLTLRYQLYDCDTPKGRPLNLRAVYTGGADGNTNNDHQEEAILQFRSDDPLFYEAEQEHQTLTPSQSIANVFGILQADRDNAWSAMGNGLSGGAATAYAIARGRTGALYVGGDFTTADGVANTSYLAIYQNGAWASVGLVAGGAVRAIAVAPNGDIYIGGAFTSAGGVANTLRIARYRPSTGVWSALGASGASGLVRSLAFDATGLLYIGGDFATIGGVAGAFMMTWNGTAYAALSSQPNASVFTLALAPGGAMVAGGLFSTVGATSANGIAAYTTAATWSVFSTGVATGVVDAAIVRAVAFLNGILYAAGNFTTAGGVTVNHIAMWTGSTWRALGSGLSLPGGAGQGAYCLTVFNNLLHVGGRYTAAGALSYIFEGYAKWNGSTWVLGDINLPSTPTVTTLYADTLALVVGFDSFGTVDTSANTTVTVNATANSYPQIRVVNNDPTTVRRLYQIANITTGDIVYFDLNVLVGETIDLDFEAKTVTSSMRGPFNGAPLAGSTLARWHLAPKTATRTTNIINVFMGGTPANESVRMFWNNRHWAVEGAVY